MRYLLLGLVALLTLPFTVQAHVKPSCKSLNYKGADYTVCQFNPAIDDIRLFLNNESGEALGSFNAVNAELSKADEELVFAMNGGMYHANRAPVGGFIQDSQKVTSINTNKGPGNFHLLPNGVFGLWQEEGRQRAFVKSTGQYQQTMKAVITDVTQSGPMLVIDGALHPKFLKDSNSRKIRNGVGVDQRGDVYFVKSETAVNFYSFATLFKDHLKTPKALYLDGTISRLYSEDLGRNDIGVKMGPIIGVVTSESSPASAQYIANEAIIVTQDETKVLFDPLPLSGFGVYPEPSASEIDKMMSGKGAYVGVDVVFISHAHRDHFSAEGMIAYMNAQPNVVLVAPKQALTMMEAEAKWDKTLLSHMRILDMEATDKPQTITIGDVHATAIRIPHAGWPAPARASVQNMVYRVSLNDGATIIHMGDADPRRQHFTPHQEHWQALRTDTAFPPYWFLLSEEGRTILSKDMNVASSIGIHVPIDIPDDLKASGEDYFSILGETREIGK